MSGSEYEFINKDLQRAAALTLSKYDGNHRTPILFLESAGAGACNFFLKAGVSREDLRPVNCDRVDADAISKASGVECVCADIDDYLTTLHDNACGVVWLDYMRRTISVDVMREALRVAPYVMVTLSLRGIKRQETLANLRKIMKKVGVMLQNTVYKGKSNIENMITFTVCRGTHLANSKPTAKTIVLPEKQAHRYRPRDKVVVCWRRDTSLTAIVLDTHETQLRVRFDCDGREHWVCCQTVTPNTTIYDQKTLNKMIGKTLFVPRSLWPKTLMGYDEVKQTGKHLKFHVVKRYHKGTRFALSGVSKKTNLPLPACESWTLTYEQASCFLKI